MLTNRRTKARRLALFAFLLCLVFTLSSGRVAYAQDAPQQQPKDKEYYERRDAYELYQQNRFVEALPLFEKLAGAHPDDPALQEGLAACVMSNAVTIKGLAERKKERIRARAIFLRAKELGDKSNYLESMLNMLPEDGSESAFSPQREVDEIMRAAEADFVRGDLDKARDGYIRALLLDPNLYNAALFTGDVFYKQQKPGSAGEWYARAIQINPDRETAYRYWGDALMSTGKMDAARSKFIEAVIAEPYNRSSRMGLQQWAERNKMQYHVLQLNPGSSVKSEGGKTTITIDPGNLKGDKDEDGSSAWLMYGMSKALWQGEKFKKEFPNETKYRHSLREETEALSGVASVASEVMTSKKNKGKTMEPSLAELVRIKEAGLLESYILLFRPDDGIVQDYEGYRSANRDKLRRLLDEVVVPKLPIADGARQK